MSTESSAAGAETEYGPNVPPVLVEFFDAVNAADTDRIRRCFTEKAVVNDGGREIRGRDAVSRWVDEEFLGAGGGILPTEVRPISQLGGDQVVTAQLPGAHRGPTTLVVTATSEAIAVLQVRR